MPTKQTSLIETAHELGEREPSIRVIGSLARTAHMGLQFDEIRPSGVRRDVDAFRFGTRQEDLEVPDGTELDLLFEHWIRPEANNTHLVFPYDERLNVELPHAEEIFAPHEVRIGDTTIRAPHADVLGAISTMQYIQRPKDRKSMAIYNGYLDSLDDSQRFDPELLEPFNVFRSALSKRKAYLARAQLRDVYHKIVPEPRRQQLRLGDKVAWMRSRNL
jgi:hypothetical protein